MSDSIFWLHIDMDAFFASVEIASRPYLKGRPVGVGGRSSERTVVAAASYPAREYGIHSGMPSAEAFARCPGIVMIKPDMDKYVSISGKIFSAIEDYCRHIEVYSVDECFVKAVSLEQAEDFARYIRNMVRHDYHITCSVGIGPNRLIAKICSDEHKPDGLTVIDNGYRYIKDKDVSDIPGIGHKTALALSSLGIHYVRDIEAFPLYPLKKRFNSYAYVLKAIANGQDPSNFLWNTTTDIKSVGNTHTMKENTVSMRRLSSMLSIIAEHVALRMRKHNVEGNTVTLTVRYMDFNTFTRRKKIYRYIHSAGDIHSYAVMILRGIDIEKPVRLIGISVSNLRSLSSQMSLDFEDNMKDKEMENTVNRIKDQFGEWSIMKASSMEMTRRPFMHFGGIDKRDA